MSKSVKNYLNDNKEYEFELKSLGSKEIFSVKPKSHSSPMIELTCPNGHGLLTFDMNDQGIYVYRCKVCGFEKA